MRTAKEILERIESQPRTRLSFEAGEDFAGRVNAYHSRRIEEIKAAGCRGERPSPRRSPAPLPAATA